MSKQARNSVLPAQREKELFSKLEDDNRGVTGDIEEQAGILHDFGDSTSERVPWLERTEFPFDSNAMVSSLDNRVIWMDVSIGKPTQILEHAIMPCKNLVR